MLARFRRDDLRRAAQRRKDPAHAIGADFGVASPALRLRHRQREIGALPASRDQQLRVGDGPLRGNGLGRFVPVPEQHQAVARAGHGHVEGAHALRRSDLIAMGLEAREAEGRGSEDAILEDTRQLPGLEGLRGS